MDENNKNEISVKYKAEPSRMQLLTENELLLPESNADIRKLIKYDAASVVDEVRISDGRINFKGKLNLNVIYYTPDGSISAYKTALPFEDFMNIEDIRHENGADIYSKNEKADVWRINERKIGLKAVSSVFAQSYLYKKVETVANTEEKNIQMLESTETVRNIKANYRENFEKHESMAISAGYEAAGEVIDEKCVLSNIDIRPMRQGYRITANIKLDITYTTEDDNSRIQNVHYEIPFDETAEGVLIDESCVLKCRLQCINVKTDISRNGDGKNRVFDVEMNIGSFVEAMKDEEIKFVEDMYVIGHECNVKQSQIILPSLIGSNKTVFQIKGNTSSSESEKILQVVSVQGSLSDEEIYASENMVEAEGVANVSILYTAQSDIQPVGIINVTIPFHQEIAMEGITEYDKVVSQMQIESININLSGGNDVEVIVNVSADTDGYKMKETKVISDYVSEEEKTIKTSSAVIFTAKENDTLWSIAKKYSTTIAEIAELNEMDIKTGIKQGDRLLIMRKAV